MMRPTLLIFSCLLLFVESVPAQTAKDVRERFGEPLEVYSVGEHTWMAPSYTVDGQLCEMRLFPKRISGSMNYLGELRLNAGELKDALDRIVPPDTRGNRTEHFGLSTITGQAGTELYTYENVNFSFLESMTALVIDPVTKKPLPGQEYLEQPSKDALPIPIRAEIAVISFPNRVCPKTK